MFREEALAAQERAEAGGPVLRLSPRWAGATYPALVLVFAAGIAFMGVGRISEYASGAGLVRVVDHAPLTARAPGTVEEVLVAPGDRVEAGQALVRLHARAEEIELDRAEAEFEQRLLRVLLDPGDAAARVAAGAARPAIAIARGRLGERTSRAIHAGQVASVGVRPGQVVAAGTPLISVVRRGSPLELVVILPGRYRPRLAPGVPMRIEVAGYSHAYLEVTVTSVGNEVVGPSAMRRLLGENVGDSVPFAGPVVLARAPLPATFVADGREHAFFQGMQALADVRVGDEPLAIALLPGLRAVRERFR